MFNNKKSKRGFSLVELMVVVAIMGTLAAIAIPAYNEYRKSAKKAAYKADLSSLHKGWLAFGVEIDSFCERETNPRNASINNVGMESLISSKLYGPITGTISTCTCAGGTSPVSGQLLLVGACNDAISGTTCAADGGTWATGDTYTANGPGKSNFIGFGAATCSSVNVSTAQVQDTITDFVDNTDCTLDVATYKMGVGGYISGNTYFSQHITETGVLGDEGEDVAGTVPTGC